MSTATKETVSRLIGLITTTLNYLTHVKVKDDLLHAEMMCLHLNNTVSMLHRVINTHSFLRETEASKCRQLINPLHDCFTLLSNQCKLFSNPRLLQIIVEGRVECGHLERATEYNKAEIRDINIATRLIAGAVAPLFRLLSHLEDAQFNDKTIQSAVISPIVASLISVLWSYKRIVETIDCKAEFYTPDQKAHIDKYIETAVEYQKKINRQDHIYLEERFFSIEGLLVEIRSLEPK